jgi:hypothetical protein
MRLKRLGLAASMSLAMAILASPAARAQYFWDNAPYAAQDFAASDKNRDRRGYRIPQPALPRRADYREPRTPRCERGDIGAIVGAVAGGLLGGGVPVGRHGSHPAGPGSYSGEEQRGCD